MLPLYAMGVVLLLCGYCCHGYFINVHRCLDLSVCSSGDTNAEKFKVVTPDQIASLFTLKNTKHPPVEHDERIDKKEKEVDQGLADEWTVLMEIAAGNRTRALESTDDYDNISQPLGALQQKQVRQALSMGRPTTVTTMARSVTSVLTDRESNRYRGYNPMSFGAYKRFKDTGKTDGRGSGGVSKGRGKRKKKGMSADSFYEAIKKLGSGPVEKGTTARTGVVEPPPGQKPIQPKKAPMKGTNRRRIITPDDIKSLFAKPRSDPLADYGDSDDSEDIEDTDANIEENAEWEGGEGYDDESGGGNTDAQRGEWFDYRADSRSTSGARRNGNTRREPAEPPPSKSLTRRIDNSLSGRINRGGAQSDDDIPKWLQDAEIQGRIRRRKGNRKPKPLLQDWRFWAAGILTVGFLAAFANMYHMTGGFGTLDSAVADKFTEM